MDEQTILQKLIDWDRSPIQRLIKRQLFNLRFRKLKDGDINDINPQKLPRIIDSMIKALRGTRNKQLHWDSVSILQKIGIPALHPLLDAMKDPYYRRNAIRVINVIVSSTRDKSLISPAVPALLEAMDDPNDIVRQIAARALGSVNDPRSIPALIRALGDHGGGDQKGGRRPVSSFAVESLERKGGSALPALCHAMCYKDESIRCNAVVLFRIFGYAQPIVLALADQGQRVRNKAKQSLEHILDYSVDVSQVSEFETSLSRGYAQLRRLLQKNEDFTRIQMQVAKLKMAASKKKNELAKDKRVLLDDKPKPPKKGMYRVLDTGNGKLNTGHRQLNT